MRHAKWIVPLFLLGGLVAVALAGDLGTTPDWLDALSTSHGTEREAAIQTLAARPDLFDDFLAEIEHDHPPILRAAIAEVLARMKLSPSDFTSVTSLLRSSQPTVRAAALGGSVLADLRGRLQSEETPDVCGDSDRTRATA